jgi:uncharacterized protein
MIIDAHAHVYKRPLIRMQRDGTTYMSVQQQLAIMDRDGISKTIIMPLNNPETHVEMQSVDEILSICAMYPDRFIPFCNIDPRLTSWLFNMDASHCEFILKQFKDLGCKGLGELAARIYWDDPALLELFAACEQVGFPITFHTTILQSKDYGLIDEIGFPRFEKVLQEFPQLVFIAHSQAFWTEISSEFSIEDKWGYPGGTVKKGGAVSRLMRKYCQLYADISANSGLNALTRDPSYAFEFIDEFQDRLLFGLDYCSITNDRKHIEWLKSARNCGNISSIAYEKLMWQNISKLLNI